MKTKFADSKGRIMLGTRFANGTFLIDDTDPARIVLIPAVAVPAREAWLYQNQHAQNLVNEGLKQARKRQFSKTPPDIDADAALTAEVDD